MQKIKKVMFFIITVLMILPIIGCSYALEASTTSSFVSSISSGSKAVTNGSEGSDASKETSMEQSIASESAVESDVESNITPESSETSSKPFVKRDKVIYLTFDDGPHPKNTTKVLDILKKYNIKATFFVIGDWVKLYPNIVKRIDSEGHAIACHSMTHRMNVIYKSVKNFEEDLNNWEKTIKEVLGDLPESLIYRFPGGTNYSNDYGIGKELVKLVQDRNYSIYDWTASNGDRWPGGKKEGETTDEYLRRLMMETIKSCDRIKDPCVVLLHDSANETVDMLEWSIETLLSQGYQFDNLYGLNHSIVFKIK